MLVNKAYTPTVGEIVGMKLKSGEELIGKVCSLSDMDITVHYPQQLAATQQGMALIPYLMMAGKGEDVTISLDFVAVFYEPDTIHKNAYEQTVSDLVLPSSKLAL
jgi:hypothetical protein